MLTITLWNEAPFMEIKATPFEGLKCLKGAHLVKVDCPPGCPKQGHLGHALKSENKEEYLKPRFRCSAGNMFKSTYFYCVFKVGRDFDRIFIFC